MPLEYFLVQRITCLWSRGRRVGRRGRDHEPKGGTRRMGRHVGVLKLFAKCFNPFIFGVFDHSTGDFYPGKRPLCLIFADINGTRGSRDDGQQESPFSLA
jgi:hypothetical protein